MTNFETLLEQCNSDIREGNLHLVATRLSHYNPSRIPQAWRLPLAKICRRAGLYALGLRLLTRLIHGSPQNRTRPATAAEITEYSALLLRSGAVNEALEKLQQVDAKEVPEKLLIQAFAFFARWEYERAIPELESYLRAPIAQDTVLMGQSNLAFAMVECRQHEAAQRLITDNIRMAKEQGHFHLENYNHALRGQVYLQEQDFARARPAIELALRQSAMSHQFFAMKLKLILEGLESKDPKPFIELRKLAAAKRDGYAMRDADLFSLKVDFDQNRFLYLYFGSPLAGFRERIHQELGFLSERHTYVLGQKSAPRFDLVKGEIDGQRIDCAGFKSHQLIEILLRDFYEPLRIAGLHSALFPGEHFNILSSPDRTHQVIRRTRRWLQENSIPVRIYETEGFYSLEIQGNFSFRIPLERRTIEWADIQIEDLKKIVGQSRVFSAKEIQRRMGLSMTAVHRLLNRAIELGVIERLGPTKRTLGYRIKRRQASQSKAA